MRSFWLLLAIASLATAQENTTAQDLFAKARPSSTPVEATLVTQGISPYEDAGYGVTTTVTTTCTVTSVSTEICTSYITVSGPIITVNNTVTERTTSTENVTVVSLVPTTAISLVRTTAVSLVPTTSLVRTTVVSVSTTTSVFTSVSTLYSVVTVTQPGTTLISTSTYYQTVLRTVTGYISVTQTVPGPTRTVPGPTQTETIPGPTRTQTVPGPTVDRTRTIATTEVLTFNRTIIQTSVAISTRLSTFTVPAPTRVTTTTVQGPPRTVTTKLPPQITTQTVTETSVLPRVTVTTTLTLLGVMTTITTQLPASTVTSLIVATSTLPGTTVVTTLPGSITVVTTQLPATTFISNILVTSLLTTTEVIPTTTTLFQTVRPSVTSSPSPPVSCSRKCQIDVTAKRLVYPGTVVVSTTYVPTVTLDFFTNTAGSIIGTSLYTQALPTSASSAIVWDFLGVPLTWPTTYAAYATFNRFSVTPLPSACQTSNLSLALPSPTIWKPLVVVESEIPNPTLVAPTIIEYLNTLETVRAQLGGPIDGVACDPVVGPPGEDSTKSLGMQTSVATAPLVGATATRFVARAEPVLETSSPVANSTPPLPPQPPQTSAAPSLPPPPPSNTPLPPSQPPQTNAVPSLPPPPLSNTPLPPPPSATPQPSSPAPIPSRTLSPATSVPPASILPSGSSRADSVSQVPSPSRPVLSSVSLPPPILPSRSTTSSRISPNGSALLSSSSLPVFTGAAVLPTGEIIGWLVGAAGLGLGLL
ncbi:hypothetical protein BDU57DRAFT_535136 [Ampelomyces quisqualis]|uniref:Uncharacterized protein n=1 Tax=Ampelomyces quisqualis TaxID=50730 RepID=A0A6A5R1E8_AMPQU|nr:hypothetical protein BDU57DRAFT_535136 [Ampelomyces quisqualis]